MYTGRTKHIGGPRVENRCGKVFRLVTEVSSSVFTTDVHRNIELWRLVERLSYRRHSTWNRWRRIDFLPTIHFRCQTPCNHTEISVLRRGAESILRSWQSLSWPINFPSLMKAYGSLPCSQQPPLDPILSQLNPVHPLTHYFPKIRLSIIIPSTSRYHICSLSFSFYDIHTSPHVFYMLCPFHTTVTLGEEYPFGVL
jgi:hypothetical protein